MTDVSLKDHLDAQIRWIDRYFEAKITSLHSEVDKAERTLNKRLEGMNEFRDALKDQASKLATKEATDKADAELAERLAELEKAKNYGDGRAAIISTVVALAISLLMAGVVAFIR